MNDKDSSRVENFVVNEIIDRTIAFSSEKEAVNFAVPAHGPVGKDEDPQKTLLVVEFKRIFQENREPDKKTTKRVINDIDATLDVVKGCLKVGAFVVPELAPIILSLAGVASFVQGFIKLVPDDTPDPVDEKFKELEKSIHELEKKMNSRFADLKSFVSEVEFTIEITNETTTLHKFMRDVLKYRTPEAIANFRKAYEKNSPLMLTYSLLSLLRHKSTNPLVMALNSEKVKLKATFEKWETAINGLIGQLLFIETIGCGLFEQKNLYNAERILERAKEIKKILKAVKEEIGEDEEYWVEIKEFFENFIAEYTNLNNRQKAQALAAKLNTYLTNDTFHVCVFNEGKLNVDYTYHCPNEKTQLLARWNKGMCNAFIYRSRKAYDFWPVEIEEIQRKVLECKNQVLPYLESIFSSSYIGNQLIKPERVRSDGLIFLFKNDQDVFIEGANFPNYPKGPGFWELVYLDAPKHIPAKSKEVVMLVSCP